MRQSVVNRFIGILFLSILIVKTAGYFAPLVISQIEETALTELMSEQKENKDKEGLKEISLKEYYFNNFTCQFFEPSVLLSNSAIIKDVNFFCAFFPAIPTPPPNC